MLRKLMPNPSRLVPNPSRWVPNPVRAPVRASIRTLFFIFSILFVIVLIGCSQKPPIESGPLDDFVKCLANNGVKMYGSYTCSICKKQRALFGPSFDLLGEIECHPRGENPQTQLCLEKDIKKTPTWTLEKNGVELGRKEGYQTIEILSEFSECSIQNG